MDESEMKKRASGKRPRKRKFTGNMYTRISDCEKNILNASASGKKIDLCSESVQVNDGDFKGYNIIDLNLMFSQLEQHLSCKICGGTVTFKQEVVCGLSIKISVECKKCTKLCMFRNSKMLGNKYNIPEVNRRFVYAFRINGMGRAAMKLFCGAMDLPQPVSENSYNRTVKNLLRCSNTVAQEAMKSAAKEEIHLSGSSDIIVSGDGSWKTRGYSSRVGVCTVIGDNCGKVVDAEVLSSYCKACDYWKKKKGTSAYNDWKKTHENECLINHSGSSGSMEVVGMVRIFQRSEVKHDSKYVGYIGDGDAKTFNAIVQSTPYGTEKEITKIECVGHIQKRMGTRLRKFKQTKVKCSDGKSVGGKGRLTDKVIDKLTAYYGNAIRENKNSLSEMRKAVWAVYFHTRSSDAEPLHSFCPTGPKSWCWYQRSVLEGTLNNFKHKETVPISVMESIKPIFNDLSHPKLLRRCLGGKTQNANESLNSLIWKICPKTQGSGKRIVEIATNEAVVLFNEGNQGRIKIMKELGLSVGINAKQCFVDLDKHRIETAELRLQQSTKEIRRIKRIEQKTKHENFTLKEGPTYAAGEF